MKKWIFHYVIMFLLMAGFVYAQYPGSPFGGAPGLTQAVADGLYQPLDADLTDLSDGTLTGSKVGTGINAANVTTGLLGITVFPALVDDYVWQGSAINRPVATNAITVNTVNLAAAANYQVAGAQKDHDDMAGAADVDTTGDIQGGANILTSAGNISPSEAQMNSYLIMTAAGEVTLPDVCDSATGKWMKVKARDVNEQVEMVVTGAEDLWVLSDGTETTANDEADLALPAGSWAVFVCMETNKWYVDSENGTVTDGGVPD